MQSENKDGLRTLRHSVSLSPRSLVDNEFRVRASLSLHGKPWALFLTNAGCFAGLIHTAIELEAINAAFVFGRIVFWAGQFDFLHYYSYLSSPRSHQMSP